MNAMEASAAAMPVTTAVVLAGGLGTRLRGTVPALPKPMAPINGRPFLEHQLDYWIDQGILRFVLSVGYRRDVIINHFGHDYRQADIEYVCEDEPLGTGGALLLATQQLPKDQPLLVLNGDTFFEVSLVELAAFHLQQRADWTFALFRTEESGRYMGMQVAADGRILSLRAAVAAGTGLLANGGAYIVNPAVLALSGFALGAKASLEDEIMPAVMAVNARFFGRECVGRFIDIGVPDDYFHAARILTA